MDVKTNWINDIIIKDQVEVIWNKKTEGIIIKIAHC